MLFPNEGLRKGRRRLEEIEEVTILSDLTWDEIYECFFIHIAIKLIRDYDCIPMITEWYVAIDPTYPFGKVSVYPSCNNGITCTFPHQSNNWFVAENNLWRMGKVCVESNFSSIGMQTPDREPFTEQDRLYWNVKRTVEWLYCAAEEKLVTLGDPYELPDYTPRHTNIFAFNEDTVSMMQWEDSEIQFGVAKIKSSPLKEPAAVAYVTNFLSANRHESVYIPHWGQCFDGGNEDAVEYALWIKTSAPLVVNGWQAPMTFGELQTACEAQGINFLEVLKTFAPNARDGKPHLVLFGFPIPKRYGENAEEMVWQALELPVLSAGDYTNKKFQSGKKRSSALTYGASPGFRPGEKGWWQNDMTNILLRKRQLDWVVSQNWNARTIIARGHYSNALLGKRIAIIGAGSLGSIFSELLVRAGITNICCVDGDLLEIGNLCRHTLTMQDLGEYKSVALAAHLSKVSPHVIARAEKCYLKIDDTKCLTPDISNYDVIIDTTGNDSVLDMIAVGLDWKKTTFLSAAVGLAARRMYLCFARNKRPDFCAFLERIDHYFDLDRAECDLKELPRDGIGCWHPLFPARSDDMWLAASTAIKVLESFMNNTGNDSLETVYEITEKDSLCSGFAPVEVRYNEL